MFSSAPRCNPLYGPGRVVALGGAGLVACPAATAEPHAPPEPDKSAYTLFNRTPRDLMRDLSADRPDTTESPYTVDAGHFQIELSLTEFTYDTDDDAGRTTRTWAVAPMLLKAGLLNNVDLQLGLEPYARERSTGGPGDPETTDGFGDLALRLKVNLWGNDGGVTAFAVMPFVTLPTASDGLGDGHVGGGVILPLAVELADRLSLGAMVEFDFRRSDANDKNVVDLVHTATIAQGLTEALGAFVEFAGFSCLSDDAPYRAYFNTGLTYALTTDIQLDAGVRVGLTSAAEDLGAFLGVTLRY